MIRRIGVLAALVALGGCATSKMSADQLSRVAKDWSLGIRASQVIPVYPLTEDLQPGDVFLVQASIEDQINVYLEKGFLPLENLVVRLPVSGYATFYQGYPRVEDGAKAPPRRWQFPDETGEADFSHAPLAAFPSYNFSVSRSGGLSVAVPVQAVPVGLNLLDSASADGTITFKDAYTYALPARALYDGIHQWSAQNKDYLAQFAPREEVVDGKTRERQFFLRVVNRVYLVKSVDVTLFTERASSGGLSAGVPQKVELLNLANAKETIDNFAAVNEILARAATSPSPAPASPSKPDAENAPAVAPVAVGGTLRLTMATSRSVSLTETFKRPLVIGYLASDFRILKDGNLGASAPTLNLLEGRPAYDGQVIAYVPCDANCRTIRAWLKADSRHVSELAAWLEKSGGAIAIADLETGPDALLRQRAVTELIKP
jgi:hypothetical protein